ncbi:MAG: hypothetical protein H6807_03265 [Planctomycetes bacterium]|nr:hypothetical protein [Planctomycetota bacterium]
MRTCLGLIFALGLALTAAAQDLLVAPGPTRLARRDDALFLRLREIRLDVSWRDLDLAHCVADLRERTGLNIILGPEARELDLRVGDLRLRQVAPLLLVQLLAEQSGLVARFDRGLVVFETPAETLRRTAVLGLYDLASRFYEPPDFPAPRLGLGATIDEDFVAEVRPEPRDDDQLVDLIRAATGAENWDFEGASIQVAGRRLIVRHTPAMQRRVARLLDALSACY